MNQKLLAKITKLIEFAKTQDKTLLYSDVKNELWKNKDLQTQFQLEEAIKVLRKAGINVVDDVTPIEVVEEPTMDFDFDIDFDISYLDNLSEPTFEELSRTMPQRIGSRKSASTRCLKRKKSRKSQERLRRAMKRQRSGLSSATLSSLFLSQRSILVEV